VKEPNFLGIEGEAACLDRARAVVLPVPYEATCSYECGTAAGPGAIIAASPNAEWYDEELGIDLEKAGIATLPAPRLDSLDPEAMVAEVERLADGVFAKGRILAGLGGEHTVSLGMINAAASAYPGLTVLQIDAHPDLRDTYEGRRVCHATVGRRIVEKVPLVQVGVRAWSREEQDFMSGAAHPHPLLTVAARRVHRGTAWLDEVLALLSARTYVTFDIDALDPSLMPATGTPEPGGLTWRQAADLLESVAACTAIVGFDVVELSPIAGLHHCDYTAARLAARLIGLALKSTAARGG
jgi:agmatinase